jgi:hypothetical protein
LGNKKNLGYEETEINSGVVQSLEGAVTWHVVEVLLEKEPESAVNITEQDSKYGASVLFGSFANIIS